MDVENLFSAIATENLRDLIHSPELNQADKLFVCGYVAYEAGQYTLAHEIFKQLLRAKVYPDESFYAATRCLIEAGATADAVKFMAMGNLSRSGRYLVPFLRENGLDEMADQLEAEATAFFEKYMSSQDEKSAHGFPKYAFPDDAVLERFFKPVIERPERLGSVLDVGCNHGVMLDFLRRRLGVLSLAGVEINEPAIAEFGRKFPETRAATKVYTGSAREELCKLPGRSVDLVYSHTLLTAVPDSNVIREMARVANLYVYVVESDNRNKCLLPNGNVFHEYEAIMNASGFDLVYKEAPPDKRYYAIKVYRLFRRRDH